MNRSEEVFRELFDQQTLLMKKYQALEQLPAPPLALQLPSHQRIVRDFAWRVTEEYSEAWDCWTQAEEGWEDRMKEELADAAHFLVELLIFASINSGRLFDFPEKDEHYLEMMEPSDLFWNATVALGRAMHFLGSRPWKLTAGTTDEAVIRNQLVIAFNGHVQLWAGFGWTIEDLSQAFTRKHEKNKARIEGGY